MNGASEILRALYLDRSINGKYSLRSFSKDVGLSHTYLSLVFRNKRALPSKTLFSAIHRLGLDPKTFPLVQDSTMDLKKDSFARLEIVKFRLLTRWYHTALMELAEIRTFEFTEDNVAAYLGLQLNEVRTALASIRRLGLLNLENGRWVKANSKLSIMSTISVEAIRTYHRQMISKAIEELFKTDHSDFKRRDITGITMAINPRRVAGAKKRIAQFRRSLEAYLTRGNCTEIYQANIQLFPLRQAGKTELRRQEYL